MINQDDTQKAIQEANQRERYIWRHTRWFMKALWLCLAIYALSPVVIKLFQHT